MNFVSFFILMHSTQILGSKYESFDFNTLEKVAEASVFKYMYGRIRHPSEYQKGIRAGIQELNK